MLQQHQTESRPWSLGKAEWETMVCGKAKWDRPWSWSKISKGQWSVANAKSESTVLAKGQVRDHGLWQRQSDSSTLGLLNFPGCVVQQKGGVWGRGGTPLLLYRSLPVVWVVSSRWQHLLLLLDEGKGCSSAYTGVWHTLQIRVH